MKYMVQIYGNVTREQVGAMSEDERKQLYAAWGALNQTPGMTPGAELDDPATATTVRVQDGQTLTTDGPFPETKEALGGWFILEADNLDAAIEVDGELGNAQDGRGAYECRLPAAQEKPAREPELPVEPRVEQRPPVDLHSELLPSEGTDVRVGLELEGW